MYFLSSPKDIFTLLLEREKKGKTQRERRRMRRRRGAERERERENVREKHQLIVILYAANQRSNP